MRFYLFLAGLLLINLSYLSAQYANHKMIPDTTIGITQDLDDWSYILSTTITATDLREHIFALASDDMQGRETGTPGNDKAAQYISNKFEKLKLPKVGPNGEYSQHVAFTFVSWKYFVVSIDDTNYRHLRDFIAFPQWSEDLIVDNEKVVFAGYGIDDKAYSDYSSIDCRNKVLLIYDGEPIDENGISLISGTEKRTQWSLDWKKKSVAAKAHGAKTLLIVSNDLKGLVNQNRRFLINRITQLGDHSHDIINGVNTIFITPKMAKAILGNKTSRVIEMRDLLKTGKKTSDWIVADNAVSINQKVKREVLLGQNLLAYIEGTDLKDEIVIVSAHYDHVGIKGSEVYNGADDNASGTSTVLEIAEALQVGKLMKHGPRRSVLCLLMTGEEKGLLGSQYYTANPVFPLEKTIADINIDMVGRRGTEYQDSDIPYNYVIGSDRLSMDLHRINETVNQKYSQILLDYKYNDEADPNRFYYRSDHYNFALKGIPSIFFFNGVHEDYHRLTDTPDKIDLQLMEIRGRQIFHLIWALSNRDQRILLNQNITSP